MATDHKRTPDAATTVRKLWQLTPRERLARLRGEREAHNKQVGRKRPADEGDDCASATSDDPIND